MPIQKNSTNKFILILLLFNVFFIACEKKNSNIGLDVLPSGDRIRYKYTDTISLEFETVEEDSLSSYYNTKALMGSYNDPYFGQTDASFLMQVHLDEEGVVFNESGTGVTANSLKLSLEYVGYYGDNSTTMNVTVYKLSSSLYADSTYYSDINAENYYNISDVVGTATFTPNDTLLEIDLDQTLADELLNADTSYYGDNEDFLTLFKGFYVKVDPVTTTGQGAIVYFDLLSENSKLTLNYTDTAATNYDYVITSECARVNRFQHDYTGTDVEYALNNDDSLVYIQGLGGVKAKITFPHIEEFGSNIAVAKAELIVNVIDDKIGDFNVPERLLMYKINYDGTEGLIPDDPLNNSSNDYFDGNYNENTKSYSMIITKYYQQLVKGQYDDGLLLFPYKKRVEANRLIIGGNNHSEKPKLVLSYIEE